MKRGTKIFATVLCLVLFAVMAMGSGSTDGVDKSVSSVSSSGASNDANTGSGNGGSGSSSAEVSVEEQVVYDANDIKITVNGIEDGWMGTELKMLIENNSGKNITVQTRNANVNGFMVNTSMSADVAAGKKANDEMTIMTSGLKDCGITDIANIEFCFHIFESDTWDTLYDTDVISVKTSIADTYKQEVDDSGDILVDTNGIKIVTKGLSANDSFWGPGVILYIENNSNQNVTVQVRDVSVNGFMVTSTMSEDVVAGKKAMSAVQFYSSDLADNSITDINEVELYFHIFDEKSWNTIFDSNVINIKF